MTTGDTRTSYITSLLPECSAGFLHCNTADFGPGRTLPGRGAILQTVGSYGVTLASTHERVTAIHTSSCDNPKCPPDIAQWTPGAKVPILRTIPLKSLRLSPHINQSLPIANVPVCHSLPTGPRLRSTQRPLETQFSLLAML